MVRVGDHTLEIIDATTGQTHQEYNYQGDTWIEGRVGDEYLLKIISHQNGSRTVAHPITVDGANIGYLFQQGPDINLTAKLGPVSSQSVKLSGDGIPLKTFRFTRPQFDDRRGPSQHGSIQVTWSEATDANLSTAFLKWDSFSPWTETQTSAQDSKKEGVGALKSAIGSSPEHEVAKAKTTWFIGKRLYTITIRYCEAAGLVAKGIIQAPVPATSQIKSKRKAAIADIRGSSKRAPTSTAIIDLTEGTETQKEESKHTNTKASEITDLTNPRIKDEPEGVESKA